VCGPRDALPVPGVARERGTVAQICEPDAQALCSLRVRSRREYEHSARLRQVAQGFFIIPMMLLAKKGCRSWPAILRSRSR
jgi:hypothetical protein